jgi:hypothetical protein
MPRRTLYAYVDGSDLDDVAAEIQTALETRVAAATWRVAPTIVNQRHERDDSYGPDDLADWDLGLNLRLPDPGEVPAGWFGDVEQIARLVGQIAERTARTFVIGISEDDSGITEDILDVEDSEPDLRALRAIIGVDSQT